MRYVASVHVYDVMDQVWVGATIRDHSTIVGEGAVEVLALSDTFAGVGEPDPREWLRDALIGLLETL